LIYKLARAIQTLPYSSVNVERAFSIATDIKTIKRNNLSVESLQACLFIKQESNEDQNIPITDEILSAYQNPVQEIEFFDKFSRVIEANSNFSISGSQIQQVLSQQAIEEEEEEQEKIPSTTNLQMYQLLGIAAAHGLQDAQQILMKNIKELKRKNPEELGNHSLKKTKWPSENKIEIESPETKNHEDKIDLE